MFPKMERFGILRNFIGNMKRENLVSNESIRVKLLPEKDYEADVSRVSPSSSLAVWITKLTFRALAHRQSDCPAFLSP